MDDRRRKTKVEPDPIFPEVWVPYVVDGKDEPILEGDKGKINPVVCKKLMRAMVLLADYNVAINMSKEDHRCKLSRVHYHISSLLY